MLLLSLALALAPAIVAPQMVSTCPRVGATPWNTRHVAANIRSWLKSVTTFSDEDGPKSMRYYPLTKEFGPHYDMHDLADFHDNPSDTGGPFENQEEAAPEDTDAEKGFVTIGQFEGGQPGAGGVAWQWCSERLLEGFLYGELDTAGTFTGPDILYIYPDFRTGLRGRFVDGEAAGVRAVTLTAERCNHGVKEVRTRSSKDTTLWSRHVSNTTHISEHPKKVEPHERRSVYIRDSGILGGGEGIFARRTFAPGAVVAYFNGVRVTEDQMFHANMTPTEEYETGRYYFGLGATTPYSWGVAQDLSIDIPERFRSFVDYRTTLGHKVNHKFHPASNTEFQVVKHPLFGIICSLVATRVIEEDEEIYVDYNYDPEASTGPHWEWYRELREQHEASMQEGDL